jgi:type VI secretion system protein ImpL
MKKLFSLIFNRWVMALLGLCAIGLLIWYVGPLVSIADYRPLESELVRIILIGLIVFIYVAKLLWKLFKAKRSNANLMEGLLKQGAPQGAGENQPAAEEIATLRKRFEEAVVVLKQARLGQDGKKSLSGGFGRFTQQWVYELPWYIFIGAPGSGKTTALVNSGLQFPLADRFGQGSIRGVGGTRNCDWWFTNDAVLLDTAGRYTTQESNQAVDSAAWSGFLQLLKKYRSRRPINGVLLTLSVSDLLEQNGAQREAHINALRKRIDELHKELNIRFPLYVLITKLDLLAGFMEFFSEFGKEEREQIWGASFPYGENTAGPPAQASFADEFTALEKRINDRLIDRLQQERDPQKRAQLYVFPQQLNTLRRVLNEFIDSLFAPSQFTQSPLLRGVYFTSGTQEGSPIDRVMGSLGRALQLDRKLLMPNRPSGKSFFITRLLKDVVFQEAGLAGTNLRWERRRLLLQTGALVLAVLVTCGAIAAWTISYTRNRTYVAEVDARRVAVAKNVESLGIGRSSDLVGLLPVLASVQRIADVGGAGGDTAPFSMGFGLYQGDKLAAASRNAYRNLLQDTFMSRLALRIEQQLRTDARDNPELLYEGLKAYLMLHDPQHFNATALKAYITADWENSLPREVTNQQRKELDGHLSALLDSGDATTAPIPADAQLIADARNAIARTPLASRIYNRLKRQGVASNLPEFTIANAAGPSAALVFTRASGKPLTSGVPGLYSFNGYYKAFVTESERVTGQLAGEEGWVLGMQGASRLADLAARARVLDDVRRLYLEDYARIWETFVNDIKLLRAVNLQQSIQLARILSAPDSPLPLLLRAIVKEVTLVQVEDAEKSSLEKATDKVKSTREDLLKLFGQQKPASTASALSRPENIVDQRFENIRRMVRGQAGGPAPIDTTIGLINELYTLLTATEAAVKGGNTPPPSDVPNKIKAEGSRMPEPIRSMLLTLSGGGTSQAMGVTRANLSQAMKASIYEFCNSAIAGRYPFTKGSTRDVTQADFARLFAAGGLIDEFFQKNLAQFVNTSTRPWSFRDMGEARLGDASGALVQFQRAQAIREVFFRGGGQGTTMRLEFKPVAMDATITQFILDVDGQLVKYSHGPQVPVQVQWPGPRGTTQVRWQLSPASTAGPSGDVFEGPWALFRMFDKVQIEATGQPEKFVATFSVEGRKTQFDVLTSSVQNPFRLRELEQFQCPSQL